MSISYEKALGFEIFIYDFVDGLKPKDETELEKIADYLHQLTENTIMDYVHDNEHMDIEKYNPVY